MEAEKGTPKAAHSLKVRYSEVDQLVWSSKMEYVMAQVGFGVGLGAVWRFPSLYHQNGGGAFLLLYVLLLFTLGIPLVFMEMALGQKVRIGVWTKIHPQLWGMGLACSLVCFLVSVSYNMFIAWSIFYLSNSFQYPLPWNQCPASMNTSIPDPECARTSPSIYFWYSQTLEVTSSIDNSGGIVWSLSVCLLVVWLLIIFISIRGRKTKGKMLYLSMMVPYAILSCLLIQSYMLEGSIYGLRHLVTTKISAMVSPLLWKQAGMQVFYNMGLGFGSSVILSSYADKSKSCVQDVFIVVLFNLAFCLMASQVVFNVLGFRATITTRECSYRSSWGLQQLIKMGKLPQEASPPQELLKKSIKAYTMWLNKFDSDLRKKILEHVSDYRLEEQFMHYTGGPGLVFMAFAEAIAKFPGSSLWSIVFFLMLINLGLNTSLRLMQGILIPLQHNFPRLQNLSLILCVTVGCLGFLCSLLFTQRSGLYFLTIFNEFAISLPLCIVVLLENIGVTWIYGAKRLINETWAMLGLSVSLMHECLLLYFTLLILLILLLCNLWEVILVYPTYGAWDMSTATESTLPYPLWAVVLGSGLILLPLLPILVGLLKCSKRPVILPQPKGSSPQLLLTSSPTSSLTVSQDQQAASFRKASRLSEAQAAEAEEEASGPVGQPSLLAPSKSMGTAIGHAKRRDSRSEALPERSTPDPPSPSS
ncbi:orphan sodium- and chloride-dependent neurotransmitter transporter NTT5 [Phascolarctos cinereus]|uniref:Orphan sodium- and chloride-dependent neurotransmitter transporter NTT5 isoform X2 n=1 Tax=Phascolarctos cinereus TaxID=38626 RepID=A0A6P5LM30_PHACI|nr:orphan sodium- and chloride-dependent neurotransmitter transporter NTT5 isoform X2 [Phascolarctos cinereus]